MEKIYKNGRTSLTNRIQEKEKSFFWKDIRIIKMIKTIDWGICTWSDGDLHYTPQWEDMELVLESGHSIYLSREWFSCGAGKWFFPEITSGYFEDGSTYHEVRKGPYEPVLNDDLKNYIESINVPDPDDDDPYPTSVTEVLFRN